MERPWFQFWARDWLDNKELRRCSPAARALLMDLMCLAHEGIPYGFLSDNVGPLTVKYMAARCCVPVRKFRKLFEELAKNGRVFEQNVSQNCIHSVPRMVKDEAIRLRRGMGGILGGNGQLKVRQNSVGFICLIRRSSDGAVKIGASSSPKHRIAALRKNSSVDIQLLHTIEVADMAETLEQLHGQFAADRLAGDWFLLTDDAVAAIVLSYKDILPKPEKDILKNGAEAVNRVLEGYPSFSCVLARAGSDSVSSSFSSNNSLPRISESNAENPEPETTPLQTGEPVPARAVVDALRAVASWHLDEAYVIFADLACQFWNRILDEDLVEGHRWYWTKLDMGERMTAIANLRARITAGEDGEFVTHMPKYLQTEWKRAPRSSFPPRPAQTSAAQTRNERERELLED